MTIAINFETKYNIILHNKCAYAFLREPGNNNFVIIIDSTIDYTLLHQLFV